MKQLKKETKKNVGVYLPIELVNKFREISEKTGISISRLVENSMRDYLLKY
jgi:metal-responsive CopG/Arc/MetJ family transcriptional regulator